MSAACLHGRRLCSECIPVDDSAKRAYDAVNLKVAFTSYDVLTRQSPWMALRLSDGGSDGVLYDSRRECVRHQLHENLCAYYSFRAAPTGFATPKHAAIYLAWHRMAYDNGMRLVDPDDPNGGQELIMPDMREHLFNQLTRLDGGRRA